MLLEVSAGWQLWWPAAQRVGCLLGVPVQATAEILGKVRGEHVAMLVHHSRNSVQKQWDETLVLALGGMARILRAHLPTLVPMPGFSQVGGVPLRVPCLCPLSRT